MGVARAIPLWRHYPRCTRPMCLLGFKLCPTWNVTNVSERLPRSALRRCLWQRYAPECSRPTALLLPCSRAGKAPPHANVNRLSRQSTLGCLQVLSPEQVVMHGAGPKIPSTSQSCAAVGSPGRGAPQVPWGPATSSGTRRSNRPRRRLDWPGSG